MKIGMLGSGDVGHALGTGFVRRGHEVMMGSRSPGGEKVRDWLGASPGDGASAGTFEEAAAFGNLLVLATAWSGTENAIRLARPENFAGKILIDATNPLLFEPNRPPRLAVGHTDSAGEQVQRWVPEARVVKAFNIVGAPHMVDPDFPGGPPDMFICGNDADAKATVTELCEEFGWPVTDIGGIEGARYLEPFAMVWILCAIRSGSRDSAFKLLRK